MKHWFIYQIYQHRYYYLLYAGWFVMFSAIVSVVGNEQLFLWINQHLVSTWGRSAYYVTWLGEGAFFTGLVIFSSFFKLRKAFNLLLAHGVAALISSSFKHFFFKGAPRPRAYFPEEYLQLVEGVDVHYWNSFPSGHTVTAFCISAVIVLHLNNRKWELLCLLLACMVGMSRIILAQHFPIDVLAGSLIGIGAATVTMYYTQKLHWQFLDLSIKQLIKTSS